MIKNMRSGMPMIMRKTARTFRGKHEVTECSLQAIIELGTLLLTSFGPKGLNKIIINRHDNISITTDSASILNELEVNHPAAKLVSQAASMQEKEIGDGSNFVILFAGELAKNALELIQDGVEVVDISSGIDLAARNIPKFLNEMVIKESDLSLNKNAPKYDHVIKTAVMSKVSGFEEHFSSLISKACEAVTTPGGILVDDVRACQVPGKGLGDSFLVNGLALHGELVGNPEDVKEGKVAAFNGSVDTLSTETKGVVLLHGADELLNYNSGEEKKLEESIEELAKLGVKFVLSGGKFGDMAKHFMAKKGITGLSITSKFELRRAVKLTRCRSVPLFGERLSQEDLGFVNSVTSREIGSTKLILLESSESNSRLATIVIRGASSAGRSAGELAVDDGVNAVKTYLADSRLLPGGGAAELLLARKLRNELVSSEVSSSANNLGVEAFAKSLEAIPKILASSCGLNGHDSLSKLLAAKEAPAPGVDVMEEKTCPDVVSKNIIDLLKTKENALRLCVDAVQFALLVDDIIMAKPAGGPKMGKRPDWDED